MATKSPGFGSGKWRPRSLLKALLITTSFPDGPHDARGRFVAHGAEDLLDRGWKVRVLAPPGDWAPPGVNRFSYPTVGQVLRGEGAPDILQSRPLGAWPSAMATTLSAMLKGVRMARPDELIVGHWLIPSGPIALAMARKSGAPVHLYAHGGDVALLEKIPFGQTLARRLDAGCAGITFVSNDLMVRFGDLLARVARSKHSVAPMGIHRPQPAAGFVEPLLASHPGCKVVVSVGRMVAIKGLEVLAKALVGEQGLVWLALGDGPDRQSLQSASCELGVTLISPGQVSEAEREACLRRADVFVQPSIEIDTRREGTPTALYEAMAAGVPCIASATGGITPLGHAAGVRLVPPGDAVALKSALVGVLNNPDERAAMARRHRAAAVEFEWSERGLSHHVALLESAGLNQPGSKPPP